MTTSRRREPDPAGLTEFELIVFRDDDMSGTASSRDGAGTGTRPRGPIPMIRRSITGSTRRRRRSSSRPSWWSRSGRNWGGHGRAGMTDRGEIAWSEQYINILICNVLAILRMMRMDDDDPTGDGGSPRRSGRTGNDGMPGRRRASASISMPAGIGTMAG